MSMHLTSYPTPIKTSADISTGIVRSRQQEGPLPATQGGVIQNHPISAPSGRAVRTGELGWPVTQHEEEDSVGWGGKIVQVSGSPNGD
jgi:hypothetical protein